MEEQIPVFKFALREDLADVKDLFIPKLAEPLSSGYDVKAAFVDRKSIIIRPGQYFKIPLGFKCFCPTGWWYQLHPRSSSFVKKQMHNLIGIIDESWEGETNFAGQYIPDSNIINPILTVEFAQAIGQIIPFKKSEIKIESISEDEFNK